MAHFAKDILKKMRVLTKELEVTLGPDTGDLDLRYVNQTFLQISTCLLLTLIFGFKTTELVCILDQSQRVFCEANVLGSR